jgi:hypothetical protein
VWVANLVLFGYSYLFLAALFFLAGLFLAALFFLAAGLFFLAAARFLVPLFAVDLFFVAFLRFFMVSSFFGLATPSCYTALLFRIKQQHNSLTKGSLAKGPPSASVFVWRAIRDSNPGPLAPEANALSN